MKAVRKTLALSLTGIMLVSQLSFAGVAIQKDNKPLGTTAVEAVKKDDHLMVPLKEVFTSLGATVSYDVKTRKITVKKGSKTFEFLAGKNTFKTGGKTLSMASATDIIKNRAYVPAHVVGQVMGTEVSYQNGKLQLGKAEATAVKVGTINGPTGIAMAKMIDDSYLGENAKVSYDMEANAQLLPAKLLKKELDIALVPTNMAAILYNKSKGDVVLLSSDIWGLLSVVTTDPKIKTWNDLKGKQIDIFGQGATPEIAFKALVEDNKMDPKKDMTYKMAYDTPATLVAAMASDNTKDGVAVLAEPFTSMLLAKNKNARVLFDVQTEWKKGFSLGFPMSSIVVRKEFLNEHPELVQAFLREFAYNLNYANANPSEVGKLVEKMPELTFTAQIVTASIPRSDFRYESADSAKAAVAKYLKVLYDYDPQTIGGKLPTDDFYAKVPMNY